MAHWYQGQLRILQTVLRETDIADYDARAVLSYMKKSHSNALVVNAGGIVDFFHNEVEPSHHNLFMKAGQEILSDLCAALNGAGMHLMVRVDFRGAQKYRYEAHPDWFAAQEDGSPKLNAQGLYAPCYLSEYANGHAAEFIRGMMRKFPIDGVWENSVAFGSGVCYCKRCREAFRRETGLAIPSGGDDLAPEFAPYRAWRRKAALAHVRLLRSAVKEFGEDKAYCAEVFGMHHASGSLHSGIDTYAAEEFDFVVGVGFLTGASSGKPYDDLTYAASAVRFLKAIDPKKTTVLLTGDNGTRWRLVKDPSAECRIWMWEAAGVGANFWNCMFNGPHPDAAPDRRNAYLERDVYGYLRRNEAVLSGQTPVAEAAILFSQPTRDRFGRDDEALDGYGVGIKGLESVLIDSHIPYGFIAEKNLSAAALEDVKVLCLPNCACLSDGQAQVIREYVRAGGKLLASFETSLYDENGKMRADFALGDVLGVSFTGLAKDTSKDCYQMVRDAGHPLLSGMGSDKTRFLMSGGKTLLVTPNGDGEAACTYVPMIPNQYPEQAWIRLEETGFPTVYLHAFGAGEAVYFANTVEALVHQNGHEDFYNLVHNALNVLRAGHWQIQTEAPDSLHIGYTKSLSDPSSRVLSFINVLTGQRRTVKRLHPSTPFAVTLHLPGASDVNLSTLYPVLPTGVHVLDQCFEDGALKVTISVPSFEEFFALHIQIL